MKRALIMSVLAVSLIVSNAQAFYDYGSRMAMTVDYNSITADSDIWGNLVVSQDSLLFFPTNFQVEAQDGGHITYDDSLQIDVSSKPGGAANRYIESIVFNEAGHYTLEGMGTTDTFSQVTGSVIFTVLEIDGVEIDPWSNPSEYIIYDNLTYTPSGSFHLPDDVGELVFWSGNLNHVFGEEAQITRLNISLNNQLQAWSEGGTYSYIEKKVVGEAAVTIDVIIPEPATVCLLGLGGLAFIRKRRA